MILRNMVEAKTAKQLRCSVVKHFFYLLIIYYIVTRYVTISYIILFSRNNVDDFWQHVLS